MSMLIDTFHKGIEKMIFSTDDDRLLILDNFGYYFTTKYHTFQINVQSCPR